MPPKKAPRRNPRTDPGSNGSAPRDSGGKFLPGTPSSSQGATSTLPPGFSLAKPPVVERPRLPAGSHVVSGGHENQEPFRARASDEGAQTPEAGAARERGDAVLTELFQKYEGGPDGAGLAGSGNSAPSSNGRPYGDYQHGELPPAERQQQTTVEEDGELASDDAALLLEPIIMPGSDPAGAGTPLSDYPDSFQDPDSLPLNAEVMARHALLRSGFLPSEVDAMDPDDLVQRGMARHEALARDDDARRRLRLGEPPAASGAPQVSSDPAQAGTPEEQLNALLEPLMEPLGEEGVGAVRKVLDLIVKPLRDEVASLKSGAQRDTKARIEQLVANSRKRWVERFPQLKNGRIAGQVQARMAFLAKDPTFMVKGLPDQEIADRIMLSACLGFGLQDAGRSRKTAAAQETRRRKAAGTQPVTRVQKGSQAQEFTDEDRQRGIFDRLMTGDLAGARDFGVRTAERRW